MKPSDLDKRLRQEGFEPLGMFHNSSFAGQEKTHTTPPLKTLIEERHLAFRIIPAYLAYDDAPPSYKDRHIIYISKTVSSSSKLELLKGCEIDTDNL